MSADRDSYRPRLLVVDHELATWSAVKPFAEPLGFDCDHRSNGSDALSSLSELKPDVVLIDMTLPELSGVDLVAAIQASDPGRQIIMMGGEPEAERAFEAVKAGAMDYLSKPLNLDRLKEPLLTVSFSIARRENLHRADAELARRFEFNGMIGRSPDMQQLFDAIRRLAPHARTLLITGETGTGKELVARAIHKMGRRSSKRFLTVNCSAVVDTLFESELFGHVRGAFTGATETKVGVFDHASGGTLFLDEIGELPLSLQPKLLRAVEYGEIQRVGSLDTRKVDVCVVAATNRDLRAEGGSGRFRLDLFYRLSIMEIHLPPLRQRREDIPILVAAFVRECAERLQRRIVGVSAPAERALENAPWTGNIRELRNVIERACILSDDRILGEREILAAMSSGAMTPPTVAPSAAVPQAAPWQSTRRLDAVQREQIRRVLEETGGNKAEAARLLGIGRRSLYRWIERFGLEK
jgi:two-component system response regulator HydG